MSKLIYSSITSVDGYMEDASGNFEWARPDEEVFAFINDLERPIATYLYGRRMYETMVFWETAGDDSGESSATADFTDLWQAADKIVYSTTLEKVQSARTRIERVFDPAAVREIKDASTRDMTVAGPQLAASAIKAGLVDELQLFVTPAVIGAGKPALPENVRLNVELLDERRFGNGTVYLRYGISD